MGMTAPAVSIPPKELLQFLRKVKNGSGYHFAAAAVGWSPLRLRQVLDDPEVQELIVDIEEQRLDILEEKSFQMAKKGNTRMLEMWLYNKGSRRGWRPITQRQENVGRGKLDVTIKFSTVAALQEIMQQGQLTPADVDDDVIEAEVVEES